MKTRSYSELKRITDFEERYEYLRLHGSVGADTFGFDRHLNQAFYRSAQWKRIRDHVITRDNGCDLGIPGHDIHNRPIIHHMNPMTVDDIVSGNEAILEPDFLITTTHRTHNAIHYGTAELLVKPLVERRPGDTRLW